MPRTTFVAQSPALILAAVVAVFVLSENVKSESYRLAFKFRRQPAKERRAHGQRVSKPAGDVNLPAVVQV